MPPVDPTQDPSFLALSPDDQVHYLSYADPDFAKMSHEDQLGYIGYLTGKPAPAPTLPAVNQAIASVPRPAPPTMQSGFFAPDISPEAQKIANGPISVDPTHAPMPIDPIYNPNPELAKKLVKGGAIVAGSMIAPELLPEAEAGGTLLSRAIPWLTRAAASGVGTGAGTMLGQAATGQNPIAAPQLRETGQNAAIASGADLALGALPLLAGTKGARGMINASVGATARDVTYGNPAKALLREGIQTPITGDIELYKQALRSGVSPNDALIAAGGRVGAVSNRIAQLAPQLDAALQSSKATVSVADTIDKPLNDAAMQIITNRAMTEAEKDTAISQIGALQQALKEGLPERISPLQANQIKQALGDRINWGGNISVTDEVKPAYRAVYGSLKNAVNRAVPESATLNERLSDLLAAQGDLKKLMGAEEVGYGKGAMGSAVTGIARRLEAIGGRAIPFLSGVGRGGQAIGLPGELATASPALMQAPSILRPQGTR